eukprot:m51a1_g7756 hypothetical protein (119) ;mRNA; f:94732-95350
MHSACQAFGGVGMTCSSAANKSDNSYLAIGVVLCDEEGVPRVYTVIRGVRSDAATVDPAIKYIIGICSGALAAIVVLVALLMEFSVLRILSSLSRKIISLSNNPYVRPQVSFQSDINM